MRKIILSILLLLFLFSCSESDEIEVLYRSGDYEAALERSNELLGNQLSENALYWKMLSSWALSMNDDAISLASQSGNLIPSSAIVLILAPPSLILL